MLLGMEFWGSNFQTHQTKALRLFLVACCLHVSLRPQEGLFGQQELGVISCWNLSSTTKYSETSERPWKHLKANHFRYQFCLGSVVSWLNCTKDHESRIASAYFILIHATIHHWVASTSHAIARTLLVPGPMSREVHWGKRRCSLPEGWEHPAIPSIQEDEGDSAMKVQICWVGFRCG